MVAPGVRIHGVDELQRAIKNAQGPGLDKEMRTAHQQIAQIVADRAEQLAPRVTDHLANSIRPIATLTSAAVRAGNGNVLYAGPIHEGWPKHHIKPQRFITDALKDRETQVRDRLDQAADRVGQTVTTD